MLKRDLSRILQERLRSLFDHSGLSISECARVHGIDRSTLSQLLSSDTFRMPRADTIAALSAAFDVSCDYLLGLSDDPERGMQLIDSAVGVVDNPDPAQEAQWQEWHDAAKDSKIRYVAVTSLPHHVKNRDTILYEYSPFLGDDAARAYVDGGEFAAEIARRSYDYEACLSMQSLQAFVDGSWIWSGYPADKRRQQLLEAADTLDSLYPDYQLYLFDEMKMLTCPLILFGTQRAVINCAGGAGYLVFNRRPHIDFFTRLFKDMIRHAVIHPHAAASHFRHLAGQIKDP